MQLGALQVLDLPLSRNLEWHARRLLFLVLVLVTLLTCLTMEQEAASYAHQLVSAKIPPQQM